MCLKILIVLLVFKAATNASERLQLICDSKYSHDDCVLKDYRIEDPVATSDVVIQRRTQDAYFRDFIRRVRWENSTVHEIPRLMFESIPKMISLDMSHCEVGDELQQNTFEHAKEMRVLQLAWNNITKVEKNVLSSAPNIESVDLSWNAISTMEPMAFSNLAQLHKINLSHNLLVKLESATFNELPALLYLDLSFNQLEVISADAFSTCSALQQIFLCFNELVWFETLLPISILKLDVSNNYIRNLTIAPVVPFEATKLSKVEPVLIDARNNSIRTFSINNELPVTHLDLSHNDLGELFNVSSVKTLVKLNLAMNQIIEIPPDTFTAFTNLQFLNLSDNKITSLRHGVFSGLDSLRELDLSFNGLSAINLNIFTAQTYLEKLSFSGNGMNTLDYMAFDTLFPRLYYIGISRNQWRCEFLADIIKYLKEKHIKLLDEDGGDSLGYNVNNIACTLGEKPENLVLDDVPADIYDLTLETKTQSSAKDRRNTENVVSSAAVSVAPLKDEEMQEDLFVIKAMLSVLLLSNLSFFIVKLVKSTRNRQKARAMRLENQAKDETALEDLVTDQ